MKSLITKSIGASLLIALGACISMILNNALGAILFAFGLLGVCALKLNLFTGKCGFLIANKIKIKELLIMLLVNLISGYLFGLIIKMAYPELAMTALAKISSWNFSVGYFIKSCLCGIIMYLAVKINETSKLGIIYGIPLFILAGFQHCIANVITMGIAATFNPALFLCVVGNFVGSLFAYVITKQ